MYVLMTSRAFYCKEDIGYVQLSLSYRYEWIRTDGVDALLMVKKMKNVKKILNVRTFAHLKYALQET